MLTRMAIRNFRVFNKLDVEDLAPINLFTGLNNAGKTSLLEAVFLLSSGGNPEMAINNHVVRGLVASGVRPVAGLWKELFADLDVGKRIEICATHQSLGTLSLGVEAGLPHPVETIANGENAPDGPDAVTNAPGRGLSFSFQRGRAEAAQGHIQVKGQNFELRRSTAEVPLPVTMLAARGGSIHDDAVSLAKLRREKRSALLLEALQIMEPKLQSIEDNSATGQPMIWGDVGLPELVPLPVMGEGMTRIARIVLAISSAPDGIVLVDEIENGLHHTVLEKVWLAVAEVARQFETQVLATTHSFECAQAAHQALPQAAFRLHRLEIEDSENRCITYGRDAIDGAFEHGFEVR